MLSSTYILGDLNSVIAPVDSGTIIARFDLVYLDTDDVKPLSSLADLGSDIVNQLAAHDKFLGVALRSSGIGDTTPIPVATTGVFRLGCDSATWELTDLVAPLPTVVDGIPGISATEVSSTSNIGIAIGRVFKRETSATENVQVQIISTLLGNSISGSSIVDLGSKYGLVQYVKGAQSDTIQKGIATDNRIALQYANDNETRSLPWFLEGSPNTASGVASMYNIDDTLVFTKSQRKISGVGPSSWSTDPDRGSFLCLNADWYRQSISGSSTLSSTTLTVTGHTVTSRDLYNSFEITGGTNFVTGWYHINGVDTVANTWTLDRACTTGGNGSALTAIYIPEPIQYRSSGNVHEGLLFSGLNSYSNTYSGAVGTHITCLTGGESHHTFNNCGWYYFDHAILLGKGMAAYGDGSPVWYDWDGKHDNHADLLTVNNGYFYGIKNCVVCKTEQSLCHKLTAIRALSVRGSIVHAEAGGNFYIDGVWMSGTTGTQRIFYLGGGVEPGSGPYVCRNFFYDGENNTYQPQLVKTGYDFRIGDSLNTQNTVVFDGGVISRAASPGSAYLVDVQDLTHIILNNLQGGYDTGGIWANAFRLRAGAGTNKPSMIVSGCQLNVATQSDVVDPLSVAGAVVKFYGNTDQSGVPFDDEVFTVA